MLLVNLKSHSVQPKGLSSVYSFVDLQHYWLGKPFITIGAGKGASESFPQFLLHVDDNLINFQRLLALECLVANETVVGLFTRSCLVNLEGIAKSLPQFAQAKVIFLNIPSSIMQFQIGSTRATESLDDCREEH